MQGSAAMASMLGAYLNPITYVKTVIILPITVVFKKLTGGTINPYQVQGGGPLLQPDQVLIFSIALLAMTVLGLVLFSLMTLPQLLEQYRVYKTYNNYISKRLADAREVLLAASEISDVISSDPALESLYGEKIKYTRQLLAHQHVNPNYNKLAKNLQENDFGNWSLFFNSMGTLMTTMTLLEENIHMFDEVLFELGHIGVYLPCARLVENPDGNKNKFTFGRYYTDQEKSEVYLNFKNSWSISINPNKAVPNDLFMDGKMYNTAAIMGPNACGKSVIFIRNIFENILLMQTGGIVAGEEGGLTPFWAIFAFKEPKDDPSIKKSLFARELDSVSLHNIILTKCRKFGKKSVTFYDEFLNSTNPSESSALQRVLLEEVMSQFSKNANFMSTHNPYIIDLILHSKKAALFHVRIHRYPDGSYVPLYKIGRGITKEKVGIDLFEKRTGNKRLADKARIIRNQIEAAPVT